MYTCVQVTKEEVDLFKERKRIPSFQLMAKVIHQEEISEFTYILSLNGAKEPINRLLLVVEPSKNIGR